MVVDDQLALGLCSWPAPHYVLPSGFAPLPSSLPPVVNISSLRWRWWGCHGEAAYPMGILAGTTHQDGHLTCCSVTLVIKLGLLQAIPTACMPHIHGMQPLCPQ